MQKLTIIGEQEEELKCDESDGNDCGQNTSMDSPDIFSKRIPRLDINRAGEQRVNTADAQQQIERDGPPSSEEKQKNVSHMSQKRHKSKQIKKILKERLNIDCLRMLCPDENTDDLQDPDAPNNGATRPTNILGSQNMNDSYHVLMREIGVEQNESLSQAFIEKNGMAPREQLNSFTEMFSVRDLLGVGAFGVVLLVKNRFTKEKSALKIIGKENLSERAQKILKNESTIMQTMDHQSVVSLKRIFENQKFIILEMELIPGGQLKRLFKLKDKKGEPKPLNDLEASKVMKSLLKGVAYVHARDIVHRDLKPENILLKTDKEDCYEVKIVDFGLSAEQNWRKDTKERAGTPLYMAPEQIIGKGYSKKIDLWACGIIAYQLLTCGQHPCYETGDDYYKKLKEIEKHPLNFNFPASFTPLAKDFFLNLCSYPPSQRYDAITALSHPWITRNEKDAIPLNQQQEFAMFQTERQLRKVMRLAYFASLVKMSHCQQDQQNNSDGAQGESSSDVEQATAADSRSVQSPAVTSSGSPIKLRGLSRWLNSNQQLVTTSTSAETWLVPRYDHDSFLEQSNFASYKQLVLREAKTQESIDSTSTDSPTPKRFRLTDDKQYESKKSIGTDKESHGKFSIPHHTALSQSKHSTSSTSPTKRNKFTRKQKQVSNSTAQKQQQQHQPIPITSPFRLATECMRDSVTQVNFNSQMPHQPGQLTTMHLVSDNLTKRKAAGAQSTFMQTQNHPEGTLFQVGVHLSDDRNLLKQASSVSQRDAEAIILPIAAVTQSKQFSFQNSQSQSHGRPGRNLVTMKSPIGQSALKEWEHVSLNNSVVEPTTAVATNGSTILSRKTKLLQKQKVSSIEQEGGSSKLAIAGQQTLTNRKQSEFLQGQKVVIKDSLRAAGASLVMPNSKTMSSEITSFEEPLKRDSSSNSLLHMSPRDKINVTSVMRKGTSKKQKKAGSQNVKNYEMVSNPDDNFSSPQKQLDMMKKRPFPHPSELMILSAVTPQGQKQQASQERHTDVKIGRQNSKLQGSALVTQNDMGEYGDCTTAMASPPKKAGTKSSKKRTLKKNKTTEMQNGNQGGSKSLNRQTTFDIQSMNGYLGSKDNNNGEQKIDWLKLAKEERTIAGSKLLSQAAELSALGQPLRSNPAGQFNYQGHFLLRQGTYQPVNTQFDSAKNQQKGLKGSRKATKSPIVNVRSFNGNQGSMERQINKKKSLDCPNALITGQSGFASLSNSISNMVQIGQSPDQYYRQSQKHKGVMKSKTLGKKQLKESEMPSPSLHNGILGSSSEQFRHMWPSHGEFSVNFDTKNVPIKSFGGATSHLDSAQKRNKQTSRAAVMSILNGTPDLLQKHTESEQHEGSGAMNSQIRSDLDDIQQRLRPRELKFEQVSKFSNNDSGPRRQNTTSGIVQQQEVGIWLFGNQQDMLPVPGKQRSFEHMSSQ